ncbi:MAG: class I SAM-dependent methyltransferase [Thiobacillaceae bacterium]|jgi:SAM-dependent methyltransferase|nr:class I SAM-dependent methyltransferase [Thiobacillaceae bacterium]
MTTKEHSTQAKHPEFLRDQRAFFDELITREWHTYHNPDWDLSRQYEVTQLFRHVCPATILDVGCGCGYHDLLMATRPETRQVYAIDYSAKSIETAEREYPHAKVRRQVADINALGADIPQVDLVVSFQVIEHTTDPARFLEQCAKQARSGGHVAIFTPNRLRLANRLRRMLGRPARLSDPQHFLEFTLEELSALGRDLGLQPMASFGYGMDLPLIGARLPMAWRLALGRRWPASADGLCVIFRTAGQANPQG